MFLLLAAAFTWAGTEYPTGQPPSPWFAASGFGIPLHYIIFGCAMLAVVPYLVTVPKYPLTGHLKRLKLFKYVVAAWAVLTMTLAIALFRGAPELFADWRNLVVVALTAVCAAKWLAAQSWRRFVVTDLATLYGLLSIPILIDYAAGGGADIFGVRTTVWDVTPLYLASFAGIAAAWNLLLGDSNLGRRRTALLQVSGAAASLLVLLSFRRSFWLLWGVGLIVVLITYLSRRQVRPLRLYASALGAIVLIGATFITLGTETVIARMESFLPTDEGDFSATNTDHVNDWVDAWTVVQSEPVFGIGIGIAYETTLIAAWKDQSFQVHNAILHVWLKFGVAGAITFLAFHVALARRALRFNEVVPIGGYLIGQLVANTAGVWPYGRFQLSVFGGLLIAALVVNSESRIEAADSRELAPERFSIGQTA